MCFFFFFAIVICQRERRINCTAIAPLFIKNNNNNSGFGSLIFFFKNIILVTELPFALSLSLNFEKNDKLTSKLLYGPNWPCNFFFFLKVRRVSLINLREVQEST